MNGGIEDWSKKKWRVYVISEFEICLDFHGIGQRALVMRRDIKKCLFKGVVSLQSVRKALQIAPPLQCSTARFNAGQVPWSLSPPRLLPSMHFIPCQVCLFHCFLCCLHLPLKPLLVLSCVCQVAPCQATALTRLPYRKAHCCWLWPLSQVTRVSVLSRQV